MNKNIKAYLGYTFILSWILLGIAAIGWRGLLQPELQKKYSVVISSLIVGVIRGAWHIPFLRFLEHINQV